MSPAPAERPLAVLLAEHEPEVAELARRYLARAGLRVTLAASADDTIAALTARTASVAVLDLTMPGLDARRLRRLLAEPHARDKPPAQSPTPAVYLLGPRMRPRDLRVSADHCLRRPFSPRMLVSRTSAITGTQVITATPEAPSAPPDDPAIWSLTLDPATRLARTTDREIPLTPAEFALLSALAAHVGRVLTRDRLQAAIGPADWPSPGRPSPGRPSPGRPSPGRAVDVHIAQLRAKLAESAMASAIRTVRGVGYILDEPADGAHGV